MVQEIGMAENPTKKLDPVVLPTGSTSLAQLAPDVQWVESYVTDNKIFWLAAVAHPTVPRNSG